MYRPKYSTIWDMDCSSEENETVRLWHWKRTELLANGIQMAALAISFLGYSIIPWAVANNKFFSQIVRIQSDRGHSVAACGPYRFVRHPSYLGMIAFELAVPIMLASWWSLLVSVVNVCLITLRTALEDRTLQNELPGYAEYVQRVRYRLMPGVW